MYSFAALIASILSLIVVTSEPVLIANTTFSPLSILPVFQLIVNNIESPEITINRNRFNTRIVNGTMATINQFPWFVSVRSYTSRGLQSICGGSLISNRWVLTAAHCTHGYTTFNLGFGSRNLNKPFISLTSQYFIEHRRYNQVNLNNDIALIELPKPIFYTEFIQAIRLPTLTQAIAGTFQSKQARVCGYGRTSDVESINSHRESGSTLSSKLNWVDKRIITNDQCAEIFGPKIVISSTMCGIGWDNDGQSTCSGDSGGPLILNENGIWTQIGIVSFVSNKGCTSGHPSGYVRTTSFLNWISVHTGISIRI